jgi:hypothetical protein
MELATKIESSVHALDVDFERGKAS